MNTRSFSGLPARQTNGADADAVTSATGGRSEPIKDWSMTTLKEKLIKIGAKVVNHGRCVAFQMAEVAIRRQMFQQILRLIAELRPQPPPAPAWRRSISMHPTETGNGRSNGPNAKAKWPNQPPSGAQQAEVRKLHKLGASLREITRETSLGLQTVRTIIGKADGSDRTNRQRNELRKLELNRARIKAWRARKRSRDALPKRITELQARAVALLKRQR